MDGESSLRERLIDVGVDLVTTEGPASLGLREIARRAGVSHGAPRRYFPTHHALLSAIARRGFEELGARVAAALGETTSPRAQLQAVAWVYVGFALERRGMFELMFRHDLLDSGPHASTGPRLRETTLPLFERFVALVTHCQEEQDTAAPPPAVTAAALWSNLHGIAQLWAWSSLQLALDASAPGVAPGGDQLEQVVTAVLNAHLGPVNS